MTTSSFFIEFLSEEIPARLQKNAEGQLLNLTKQFLINHHIDVHHEQFQVFSTPRRLIIAIHDIQSHSEDIKIEKRGPRVGAPEQALMGFCKSNTIDINDLVTEKTPKGDFYFYRFIKKGEAVKNLIQPLLTHILSSLKWPKSMRWGSGSFAFIRPLEGIFVCFDGEIMNGSITIEGDPIELSSHVKGQRFFGDQAPLKPTSFDEYKKRLLDHYVDIDRCSRQDMLIKQLDAQTSSMGLIWNKEDHRLMDEVIGLVEYPIILIGQMDDHFLELPIEILITSMKNHQKYIPLLNKDGSLSAYFAVPVPTPISSAYDHIISGHQKVLRARLNDAQFFYSNDLKRPLSSMGDALRHIVEHAQIGTIKDKIVRMQQLLDIVLKCHDQTTITQKDKTSFDAQARDRMGLAISLCKNDLVSEMVYEFPELQGIMGYYYALKEYNDPALSTMIQKQYDYQQNHGDAFADNIISLVDKLDSLMAMFAVGIKPTGDKDPYGLRRALFSILRCLLMDHGVHIHCLDILKSAVSIYEPLLIKEQTIDGLYKELEAFYLVRSKKFLLDYATSHLDEHKDFATTTVRAFSDDHFKHYSIQSLYAMVVFLTKQADQNTDHITMIAAANERCVNILRKSFHVDIKALYQKNDLGGTPSDINDIFQKYGHADDQKMWDIVKKSYAAIGTLKSPHYVFANDSMMNDLSTLATAINAFFDNVMMNDPDEHIKKIRRYLLEKTAFIFYQILDFSKI